MKKHRKKAITLVGMSGPLKSNIGKHLAKRTGLKLVDLDRLIFEKKGKSQNENGQPQFSADPSDDSVAEKIKIENSKIKQN